MISDMTQPIGDIVMKSKIIFLIPNLKHGGAEHVLVNLVNNLDAEKYDITIQTLFDVGIYKKQLKPHIHYRSFLKKEFRANSYLFKCFTPAFWWKRITKERYDIAISYLEGPTTRILSGCTDRQTKLIAWLHIELNSPKLAAQGFRTVKEAQNAYERFHRIIAVSDTVRACFLKNMPLNGKIDILYNTNETEQIKEMALQPVDDERFQTGNTLTVCSVAKLMKTKGFDRLIEAHKQLLRDGIEHRIYILGIGEEKDYLEKKIREYGLERTFVLLGYKENPYQYISRCDLYVCSSRREGFSTAVTESLILGTPVISTECSGAKELLGNNDEYGLVVENSTKGIYWGLKRMLQEPGLLEHYKKQAQIRGMYFSREKTVTAVENMLENIE